MKKHSKEIVLTVLSGFLIYGFYQLGVMDRAVYTRDPGPVNTLQTLNNTPSTNLDKKEESIPRDSKSTTLKPVKLLTNQVFKTTQAVPKVKVVYEYNKYKSPLSVQYKDLPYIDNITMAEGENDIPKNYPDLYKEKNYDSKTPLKKILMWNDAYSNPHFGFGFGQQPFLLANCPVNTCFTTHDRKKFNHKDLDAVVWHFRANDKSLPRIRSDHTRYVFWMMESAVHLYGNLKPYNGVFNYTMLYRMDSDIYHPYGMAYKRRSITPQGPYVDYAANKTKMAAWFVSNCYAQSGRNKLTESLQKHIDVHVYGNCGKYKCERKHQFTYCLKMLESDYKFYFSFENSLCRDYVTEKFWSILNYNVIPVVYGFGNYSLQAPPHSYIDVLDYPNVEALADYLKYLDKNNTAYNEYFDWKRSYKVLGHWTKVSKSWCQLCAMLHTDDRPKVYKDLYKWFVTDSHCKSSSNPLISNFINGKK